MNNYIYLISPPKIINKKFYKSLNNIFATKKIKYFQLRLKKISTLNLIKIAKKIKKITKKNKVKLLINDNPFVAKAVNADFSLGLTGTPIENRLADLWNSIIKVF